MDRAELSDYSGLLGRLVGDRRSAPTAAAVAVNEDREDRLGRIEAAIAALTAKIAAVPRPLRLAGGRSSTLYCSFYGKSQHEVGKLVARPIASPRTAPVAWTIAMNSLRQAKRACWAFGPLGERSR